MTEYSYMVAGLRFVVAAPECFDIETLLPSFEPFREASACQPFHAAVTPAVHRPCRSLEATPLMFRFTVQADPLEIPEDAVKVEEDENDMGHTRLSRTTDGRYCLELGYGGSNKGKTDGSHDGKTDGRIDGKMNGSDSGIFITDASFSEIYASVFPLSPLCGLILSSMLRIAFAQAILLRDGISIHASSVAVGGRAFLFLGKSGTGKSTHARMWLRNIPGSHLLNDDNPALRVVDGEVFAFGTPWSGKTPCYRNESFPVGGIARLVRSDVDIFTKKDDVAAFVALLPSCSVVRSDTALHSRLCDTITKIIELTPVGVLECLPDDEAAIVCYNNFKSLIK